MGGGGTFTEHDKKLRIISLKIQIFKNLVPYNVFWAVLIISKNQKFLKFLTLQCTKLKSNP